MFNFTAYINLKKNGAVKNRLKLQMLEIYMKLLL